MLAVGLSYMACVILEYIPYTSSSCRFFFSLSSMLTFFQKFFASIEVSVILKWWGLVRIVKTGYDFSLLIFLCYTFGNTILSLDVLGEW